MKRRRRDHPSEPGEIGRRLGLLVEQMPAVLWSVDRQLRFTSSRGAGLAPIGLSPDEVVGQNLYEFFRTLDLDYPPIAAHRRALAGESITYELDWAGRTFESHLEPFRDARGAIHGVIGVSIDITSRRRAERLVEEQNQILRMVATGAPLEDSLARLAESVEHQAPGMLCSILLLDATGQTLRTGAAPSLPAEYNRCIDGVQIGPSVGSCGTAAFRGERVVVADIANDPLWVDYRDLALAHDLGACWSEPVRSSVSEILGTLALYYRQPRAPSGQELRLIESAAHFAAIAVEASQARERLVHSALHDPLTDLPNRTLFLDRLEMALRRSRRREGALFAILFIDIDRFKLINDSLGHVLGDELLRAIAARLRQGLRPTDTVARLGGDEFALLLEDLEEEAQAARIALRIHQDFELPFEIGGQEVFSSASVGITLSSPGYSQPEELLRDADTAMYRAKVAGRGRHAVFDPEMHERALSQLKIESALHRALQQNELLLHYQPIVDLVEGGIVGFEALLRWQHPQFGLLAPEAFLGVAEDSGLMPQIGRWVLCEACRQTRFWQESCAGAGDLRISVNVHAVQFLPRSLTESVMEALAASGLSADYLRLEITEDVVLLDSEAALVTVQELRGLGLGVCLDDFGTGYSSLSYLARFPVTTLKIDRSFVRGLHRRLEGAIVASVASLAHSLGLDVVAEGIETPRQLAAVRALGCALGQGFLFSPPLDPVEAEALLGCPLPWRKRFAGPGQRQLVPSEGLPA